MSTIRITFSCRLRTLLVLVALSGLAACGFVFMKVRPLEDLARRRADHYAHAELTVRTYVSAKRRLIEAVGPMIAGASSISDDGQTYLGWKRELREAEQALTYCAELRTKYVALAAQPWRGLTPDPLPPTSTARFLVGPPPGS
jgi:hypothetical protein